MVRNEREGRDKVKMYTIRRVEVQGKRKYDQREKMQNAGLNFSTPD